MGEYERALEQIRQAATGPAEPADAVPDGEVRFPGRGGVRGPGWRDPDARSQRRAGVVPPEGWSDSGGGVIGRRF